MIKINIKFILSFYMLASKSRAQYGSIDTSNTNICPLVTILWQNTQEQQNVTHSIPYLIEIFITMYGRTAHLYIEECSTVYYSLAVEEESSHPCVECEVPGELLLYRDQLIPPLEIGFERFEENESDNATIPEEFCLFVQKNISINFCLIKGFVQMQDLFWTFICCNRPYIINLIIEEELFFVSIFQDYLITL